MARSLVRRVSLALGLSGLRAGWRPRCPRSGIGDYLTKSQQPRISPARLYGNESALDYILGISKKESQDLIGQHPPPVNAFQEEHNHLLEHLPDQPENPKILRIAVIGAPNAGKSTLVNQLLGRKVLPVSRKVHTTRCNARGVITKEDTQLVILDTPGLTTQSKAKRHNLEKAMLSDPYKSMQYAGLVVVLVDVSDRYTRAQLHPQVLYCLNSFPQIPSVLVLNKVDKVKTKTVLLDLVVELTEGVVNGRRLRAASASKPLPSKRRPPEDTHLSLSSKNTPTNLREADTGGTTETLGSQGSTREENAVVRKGWPNFQEVFMLAAVNGEEVDTLKAYLMKQAKPGPWEFHSEVLTTQTPQEICDNIIREKLLEHLPEEVPYTVTQRTEAWEEGPGGELVILQKLVVNKESHVKMLIGHQGHRINQIALEASANLMNAFLCDVRLKLSVQLKK